MTKHMKHLTLLFLFLSACGSSTSVEAATELPLYIYNIKTADSIDEADAIAMAEWMRARYEEATGFTVTYMQYEEIDAATVFPNLDLHSSDNHIQSLRLVAFNNWLGVTKRWHKGAMHYGVFPPMNCNGMKCFGGMAYGGCNLSNGTVAIGQAGKWSSHTPPRPRIPVGGGIVLTHECSHGVAMWHHSIEDGFEPNIMDQAAGRFVDSHPTLSFLPISVQEFNGCVVKAKKDRIKFCKKKAVKAKKKQCLKRAKVWLAIEATRDGEIFPAFQ